MVPIKSTPPDPTMSSAASVSSGNSDRKVPTEDPEKSLPEPSEDLKEQRHPATSTRFISSDNSALNADVEDSEKNPSSPLADPEKQEKPTADDEEQWISGVKLWMILVALSFVCFLMLLDMSILSTVRPYTPVSFVTR